jgi:hypothetical protein
VDVRALVDAAECHEYADVAVVRPDLNQIRLLAANPHFAPLHLGNVGDFGSRADDGLLAVGFPQGWKKEWVGEDSEYTKHFVKAEAAAVPARRLRQDEFGNEPREFWDRPGCVYARVDLPNLKIPAIAPFLDLDSIVGMSGGPVFGVRKLNDDRACYAPVGVQSAWLRESRIIRVEPWDRVTELMQGAE